MIAILTDPGVGGTFLNWTLHYLSGHDQYYSAASRKLVPLVTNPLTSINSHNFLPNQPTDLTSFQEILQILVDHQSPQFSTIYFHNFRQTTDTSIAVKTLLPNVSKTILLTSLSNHELYQCNFNSRTQGSPGWNQNIKITDNQVRLNDLVDFFFKDSKTIWDGQGLNNIWDIREFYALNFRPFSVPRMIDHMDLSVDHYHMNVIELWDRFDQTVEDLFCYLGIEIHSKNLKKWHNIYQQWKKTHKNRLFFVWYFDIIIKYILEGHNFDLSRLQLDIVQEAAIQHVLIYQHGLNLKTWQLEKFQNTKQLHALLEPNLHTL